MQNYTEIAGSTSVKDSRALLLSNDKTIMSNHSGTAFPTTNLQVGMHCVRTDQQKEYVLKSTGPDIWVFFADLSADVNTLYATHAQGALADSALQAEDIGTSVQAYDADTAKLDAKQNWTAQQAPMKGNLTDAATVTWDGDTNGQVVKLTTTASRTMGAPTNIVDGNLYVLRLNTGGFTPSWNAAYKWPSGASPSGLSNGVYVFTFMGGTGNTLEPTGPGYLTGA